MNVLSSGAFILLAPADIVGLEAWYFQRMEKDYPQKTLHILAFFGKIVIEVS